MSGLSGRGERQYSREIAQVHARSSLKAAREVAKVEAICEITEEALFRASEVAGVMSMLAERTPCAGFISRSTKTSQTRRAAPRAASTSEGTGRVSPENTMRVLRWRKIRPKAGATGL